MRVPLLGAAVLATGLSLSGCGLLVGHALRAASEQRDRQAEVVASLARLGQLVTEARPALLADMFTADGQLSWAGEATRVGRPAIDAFFRTFADHKVIGITLTPATTDVDGQTGTQQGSYAQTLRAPDGHAVKAGGRFDIHWRHQPDGRWLIVRLQTVAAPAAPPPPG